MHIVDLPSFPVAVGRGVTRDLLVAACVWTLASASAPALGAGESSAAQPTAVEFDIPAQPLAEALIAYGAATGLEVYYDGALAIGRRSAPLTGKFTPAAGLTILLRGSGYVPRATGPDTFTLVAAPAIAPRPARVSDTLIRRYEPYFAALQARIAQALCGARPAERNEIIFSLSVDPSGVVSRAEILGSSGDPARDAAVSAGLRGVSIGQPPPADLPQPVTMAVYPPSPGEASACAAPDGSEARR
jgi:hypothetical protein